MKRIILSIILGIIIPIIYFIFLATIARDLPDSLNDFNVYGEVIPGIVYAPIAIPFYFFFFTVKWGILPQIASDYLKPILTLLFNWCFYATITYFILGRFKSFKKKTVEGSPKPPEPPQF